MSSSSACAPCSSIAASLYYKPVPWLRVRALISATHNLRSHIRHIGHTACRPPHRPAAAQLLQLGQQPPPNSCAGDRAAPSVCHRCAGPAHRHERALPCQAGYRSGVHGEGVGRRSVVRRQRHPAQLCGVHPDPRHKPSQLSVCQQRVMPRKWLRCRPSCARCVFPPFRDGPLQQAWMPRIRTQHLMRRTPRWS